MDTKAKDKKITRPDAPLDQQLLVKILEFLNSRLGVRSFLIANEDYWIDEPKVRTQSAREILAVQN
jgi:hypothetical protein